MRFAVYLFSALILFMVAGALPEPGGAQLAVFRTPLFIGLLSVLSVCLIGCCRRRIRWRDTGFILCHVGIVLILLGAGLGYWLGKRTQFAAPIAVDHSIRELPGPNETGIPLTFGLAVSDFSVDYYSRSYNLYRPPPPGHAGDEAAGYAFIRTVPVPDEGQMDVGEGILLDVNELRDEEGRFVLQHILPNGDLMQLAVGTPRSFRAVLRFEFDDRPTLTRELSVNHPVRVAGWHFYLMSYDREAERYVVLSARRDPGRLPVIAGIWAVIAGTAVLCWRQRGGVYEIG